MSARRFSLWLLPPPDDRARFAHLIEILGERLQTPRFEPHITLCGTIALERTDAEDRARRLALGLRPIAVRLSGIGYTDEYFRCLFAVATPTPALLATQRVASAALGLPPDPGYFPHLSLVYAHLSRSAQVALRDELAGRTDVAFTSDRIALYDTEGAIEGWRCIREFSLNGTP